MVFPLYRHSVYISSVPIRMRFPLYRESVYTWIPLKAAEIAGTPRRIALRVLTCEGVWFTRPAFEQFSHPTTQQDAAAVKLSVIQSDPTRRTVGMFVAIQIIG